MNERILVVDDEKAIADLVGIYLTKEGFDVQIAYSGADAAKAILEQEFDLAHGLGNGQALPAKEILQVIHPPET